MDWQRGKQEEKPGRKASPSTLAHLGRKQVTNGWECWPRCGEDSDSSGKASNFAVTSSCCILGVSFLWLSQWFSTLVVNSITRKLKISVPRCHPRPFKQELQRAENNIRIVHEAPQVTSTCSQGLKFLLPALLSPYSFCGNAATPGTVFWKGPLAS